MLPFTRLAAIAATASFAARRGLEHGAPAMQTGAIDPRIHGKAVVLFRDVIDHYPHSTKIALSAYFIAEIYKEYFNENTRAVKWYERAWQWDKNITEPARFQAATVYDLRLKNPKKAIECYRAAIKDDPWRLANREYAQDRIKALTGE